MLIEKIAHMKKLFHRTPLLLFFVFFSTQGFTQTDTTSQTDTTKQKSLSPLLDKYYTRPKEDPVAKKPIVKSKGVQQQTVKTPAPAKQVPIEEKRLTFPTPARPAIATTPPLPDSATTVVAEAPVMTAPVSEPVITAPLSKGTIVADTKISKTVTDTTKITRPVITSTAALPPKTTIPKPQGFKRPRLGSSSPLYDTYEKNNNGAGSVTTLPKR